MEEKKKIQSLCKCVAIFLSILFCTVSVIWLLSNILSWSKYNLPFILILSMLFVFIIIVMVMYGNLLKLSAIKEIEEEKANSKQDRDLKWDKHIQEKNKENDSLSVEKLSDRIKSLEEKATSKNNDGTLSDLQCSLMALCIALGKKDGLSENELKNIITNKSDYNEIVKTINQTK